MWRFEAPHPEWSEAEGGDEGWEQSVAWWAVVSPHGLVLVDPLVFDWTELDRLVQERGGCAGVLRSLHWHQRSVAAAAARYGAEVWAKPPPEGVARQRFDHPVSDEQALFDVIVAFDMERDDEIALWLPAQAALLVADVMLRRQDGKLRVCPDSWTQPEGGPARLRALLRRLTKLPLEHALVSHGPLVLGDGAASLRAALV